MIKSGIHPADVPEHNRMKHVYNSMPLNCTLTQKDINHMAKQSIAYTKKCMDNSLKIKWPEHGTWPNWPSLNDDKESKPSCIANESNKHFSDQNMHAPQLGINSRSAQKPTKKDSPQKMTAAQKHAQKLAKFTL